MKRLSLILFFIMCYLTSCSPVKTSPAEEIQTIIDSADTNYKEENYDLAEADLIIALSTAEKEYGKESKEVAEIYLKLAMYSTAYKKAIAYTQSAETIYDKLNDMSGLAETYETYALMHDRKHKPELAQEAYEKALLYCDKSTDDMSDKKFHIYLSLAPLDHLTDEESLNYGIEAEKLLDKLASKDKNAGIVLVYTSIGNSYYNMEEDDKAIENYEKVINCWIQYGQGDQLKIANCYDHCGYSYVALGNYNKAIEYINKSIDMLKKIKDDTIWDCAVANRHLSVIYMNGIKDYEKSMKYGIKSCQIYEKRKNLTSEELDELILLKDALKELYEKTPYAEKQDFESWYLEQIK